MKKDNNYKRAMEQFQISDDFIERTKYRMKQERGTKKKEVYYMNKRTTLSFVGAAAVVVAVGAIAINSGILSSPKNTNFVEDAKIYTVQESLPSENSLAADGITIPEIKIGGGQKGVKADMVALFVYQGKIYTQSQTTLPMIDGVIDKTAIESLKGDFLGKTKGGIDEWSGKDAYTEDFVSNIGESEIYTVKGYDSKYRLMAYTEYEGGYDCQIYDSFGGLTVTTGADYFDKLQLKGNVTALNYQSYDNWNNGIATINSAPVDEQFNQFMDALYQAIPIGENSDFFTENTAYDSQKFVQVTTKDNLTTTLRLFKDGYVYANGVGFFQVDSSAYDAFYQSLPVEKTEVDSGSTDIDGIGTAPDAVAADVTVTMKESSYPVGTKAITLVIDNKSANEYYYGVDYKIEKLNGSTWETVPGSDEMAFIDIAKSLPANSTENFDVDLSLLKNLSEGTYHIIKNINGTDFTVEFTLTK